MVTRDVDELDGFSPKLWQLNAMKCNPSYVCWGVGEDYMPAAKEGNGHGWNSSVRFANWSDFSWALDDLNECVNFYFFLVRDSHQCMACDGSGLNAETKRIADNFYDYSSETGHGWCDEITQDEVQALVDNHRLFGFTHVCVAGEGWKRREDGYVPTAQEVNKWQRGRGIGHDAINRWILIKARAKRMGVWGHCDKCHDGTVFDSEETKLGLMLWMLHPRKGCSRGVEILNVAEVDVLSVYEWLNKAAERNTERFKAITI